MVLLEGVTDINGIHTSNTSDKVFSTILQWTRTNLSSVVTFLPNEENKMVLLQQSIHPFSSSCQAHQYL